MVFGINWQSEVEVLQSKVYKQCTVCHKEMTENEVKKHAEAENFFFTICESCLDRNSERFIRILQNHGENKQKNER